MGKTAAVSYEKGSGKFLETDREGGKSRGIFVYS